MPKRYYCDFCDKSFADNPVARKNHMNGVFHQRKRKQHYDSFRDPEIILFEETNKKPCKHFMQSGTCTFMENCKYSHLTQEGVQELKQQVEEFKKRKTGKASKGDTGFDEDKFKEFLKRIQFTRPDQLDKDENFIDKEEKYKNSGVILPNYTLLSFLQVVPNLPPSLLPPHPESFLHLELQEWG